MRRNALLDVRTDSPLTDMAQAAMHLTQRLSVMATIRGVAVWRVERAAGVGSIPTAAP